MTTDRPAPDTPAIPEPGPDPQPSFDEPLREAPPVVDAPARNTEF